MTKENFGAYSVKVLSCNNSNGNKKEELMARETETNSEEKVDLFDTDFWNQLKCEKRSFTYVDYMSNQPVRDGKEIRDFLNDLD